MKNSLHPRLSFLHQYCLPLIVYTKCLKFEKYGLMFIIMASFADVALTQTYDVVWTNLVGVSVGGSTLTSTMGGWGNSGAASTNLLPSGVSGYLEFAAGQTNVDRMIGLSASNPDASWASINYAAYLKPNGAIMVYENGTLKYTSANGAYITTDIFRVERTGTQVSYKKNGAIFYTSTVSSTSSLIVDVAFYTAGISLANAKTSFAPPGSGNTPPTISFTSPSSGSSFPSGQTIVLKASAADPDGSISNVQFYDGAVLVGQTSINPYTYSLSTLTVGVHSITAKAIDNLGLSTTTSPISITIVPAICTDGIQNGTETGIDCGGSCAACGGATGNAWSGSTTTIPVFRTGRVHIGQTNTNISTEAAYGLYVVGGIKTDKIKIELSSSGTWADYIFNTNYRLLPLKELERFINKYHHLPGFPSEASILKAGGYEIDDIIKKQQVAIENLHLYLFELQKRDEKIAVLQKKLETVESRLNKLIK